jgi:hypothetical protein
MRTIIITNDGITNISDEIIIIIIIILLSTFSSFISSSLIVSLHDFTVYSFVPPHGISPQSSFPSLLQSRYYAKFASNPYIFTSPTYPSVLSYLQP